MYDRVAEGWVLSAGATPQQQARGLRFLLAVLTCWQFEYPLTEEAFIENVQRCGRMILTWLRRLREGESEGEIGVRSIGTGSGLPCSDGGGFRARADTDDPPTSPLSQVGGAVWGLDALRCRPAAGRRGRLAGRGAERLRDGTAGCIALQPRLRREPGGAPYDLKCRRSDISYLILNPTLFTPHFSCASGQGSIALEGL